jgi:bacteriocin-like protein
MKKIALKCVKKNLDENEMKHVKGGNLGYCTTFECLTGSTCAGGAGMCWYTGGWNCDCIEFK